jgi:AcrR family transcriptional regulator
MLFEALEQLLHEKDFEKVSVQDIAEKAELNRATFYDHYPDKFALLESMVGERFESLVIKRGLRFDVCAGAVKGIALIVCDFVTGIGCGGRNKRSQLEMHVQAAVIATIKALIVEGSRKHHVAVAGSKEHRAADDRTRALVATAAAWAICGAVNEWAQTPHRCPANDVAEAIEHIVSPMFSAPTARTAS